MTQVKHTGQEATTKQREYVETLARQRGTYGSQAIKQVLGKNPVRLNRADASRVIDNLKAR